MSCQYHERRASNLPPRIHELPHGMLNSIGLENVGLVKYVAEKLPQLNQHRDIGVMVSVAAETEDEFVRLADAFAAEDGYDGLELNLSLSLIHISEPTRLLSIS